MKFVYTTLLSASCLLPTVAALAQVPAEAAPTVAPVELDAGPQQQVALHPVSMLANRLNIEAERRLTPTWSALVAPKIGLGKLSDFPLAQLYGRSLGLEAGGRWYAAAAALRGFYLQPTVSYEYFYPQGGSLHHLGVHGKAGYQWLIGNRAVINLAGGVQYAAGWVRGVAADSESMKTAAKARGFLPDVSFAIGVAF